MAWSMGRVALKSGKSKPALGVKLPEILSYTNYRQYLKDYYEVRKQLDPGFSLRFFAKMAKFPSHGLLKYLMEGKRNLGKRTLDKLSAAFAFNGEQSRYFENLVFFNQASNLEEQQFYYKKLVAFPGKSTFKRLETSQLKIFENWYTIAIREMLNLKEFKGNAEWIVAKLLPPIQKREAAESLNLLLVSGLIKRTANGYAAADPDITTSDEVRSFLVKSYHDQMLKLAAWAQDEIPGRDRDISSVCFAIKESELPNLKKQLQLMRKELRNFAAESGKGERLVQVNLQMFPLTRAG